MRFSVILLALAGSALGLPSPAKAPKPPKPVKFVSIDDLPVLDRTESDVYQALQNDTEDALEARDLSKRALGGVYITRDVNWAGPNKYSVYGYGQCVNLLGTSWYQAISSFGPDEGTWCTVYISTVCGAQEGGETYITFGHPGVPDLRYIAPQGSHRNWNDLIGSFMCWY